MTDTAKNNSAPAPISIGWWEWVRLPGITGKVIKGKCDTGATISALHAEEVSTYKVGDLTFVRFRVFGSDEPVELRVVEMRAVRSSNGEAQERPVVLLPVEFAGVTFAIDCTLTDRTPMTYPMLLGRSALAGRFVVDPSQGRLHRKPTRRSR